MNKERWQADRANKLHELTQQQLRLIAHKDRTVERLCGIQDVLEAMNDELDELNKEIVLLEEETYDDALSDLAFDQRKDDQL